MVAAILSQPAIGARLGDILVAWGQLTRRALEDALAEQRRTSELLGALLLRQGAIKAEDLLAARAAQAGIPHLGDAELLSADVETAALERIPRPDAERLGVLPLELEGDTLWVASAEPDDRATVQQLRIMARVSRVRFVLAHEPVLRLALDIAYARLD